MSQDGPSKAPCCNGTPSVRAASSGGPALLRDRVRNHAYVLETRWRISASHLRMRPLRRAALVLEVASHPPLSRLDRLGRSAGRADEILRLLAHHDLLRQRACCSAAESRSPPAFAGLAEELGPCGSADSAHGAVSTPQSGAREWPRCCPDRAADPPVLVAEAVDCLLARAVGTAGSTDPRAHPSSAEALARIRHRRGASCRRPTHSGRRRSAFPRTVRVRIGTAIKRLGGFAGAPGGLCRSRSSTCRGRRSGGPASLTSLCERIPHDPRSKA